MNINIKCINPLEVSQLPYIVRHYLEITAKHDPLCELNPIDILVGASTGEGLLCLVSNSDQILGVIYYLKAQHGRSEVLNIATLGGKNIELWLKELFDFSYSLAQTLSCEKVIIMSRIGWQKKYPQLKVIGSIYSFDIA